MTNTNANRSASGTPSIVIYRSTDAKPVRITKAKAAAIAERLACARIQRPSLADLFLTGAFYSLAPLDSAERTTPALRQHRGTAKAKGYVVPAEELGRTGRADQSVANSIRLWLTKNLGDALRPEDLTVVSENV